MLLNTKTDVKRSGMILLIVVAFLSMFLVVGTTYLLVADSIRRTSDFDLNATDKRSDYALMPDIDPRYMFNFALGQILYDVVDPVLVGGKIVTTNSVIRGNSLARDIYGSYIAGGVNDRPFQRTPPYTYTDSNHLFLGSYKLDTAGTPTINPSFNGLDAVGLGLDVKNLEGYPGGNDSYWIDAGFPVMTTQDGRKYKALIAPLILDLDGRINLNVAGNLMQRNIFPPAPAPPSNPPTYTADHASNQGWGRWEINPKKLIDTNPYPGQAQNSPLTPTNEFLNLLSFGTTSGNPASPAANNPIIIPATYPTSQLTQWKTYGRLVEANYLPVNGNPPTVTNFTFLKPHSYAQVDFNGAGDSGVWGATTKPTYNNLTNGFPLFNGTGFGNGYAYDYDQATMTYKPDVLLPNEYFLDPANLLTSNYHARNYNPYRTQSNANGISTVFPVSETASILRWQGKGEPYSKSQVAQLLPKSLGLDMPYESAASGGNADAIFRQRIRNMVTTLSADLDRPAMVPIDLDLNYKVVGNNFPNDYPLRSVDTVVLTPNSTTPPLKLDLNRVMRKFPKYNANNTHYNLNGPGDDPSKTAQQEITFAETDRRSLAQDIYNTLRNVTAFNGVDVKTNKWFAQLAVNIVDYIDNDDFSTAWQYDNVNWVFGVEMPRLVINEVYVQVKNNKMDDFKVNNQPTKSRATKDYDVNTYIELKNPLPLDPGSTYDQKPGSHKAMVQYNDGANDNLVYRLVMNKRGVFWEEPPPVMGKPAPPVPRIQPTFLEKINEVGNPYGLIDYLDMADPNKYTILDVKTLSKWNAGGDMAIDPNSYFVVSSQLDFKANDKADPSIIQNFQSGDFNYTLAKDKNFNGADFPVILLQKLPRPWLPEDNNLLDNTGNNNINFNPFVTVDTFHASENNSIMDRREYDDAKDYDTATEMNPNFITNVNKKSIQRQTPYLDAGLNNPGSFYNGKNSTLKSVTMRNTTDPLIINNNNNNNLPWFTFLDRQLINPMELIHVPCCKPHELTQMATRWGDSVVQGGVTTFPFAANWPWFDENTRLYRFLEAVGVSPLQAGEAMHGRVLGKVNVNTMQGEEVFQAVADAKPAGNASGPNNFTGAEVTNGFNTLNGQRPILSFGQANYTDAVTSIKYGLNKSLMGYPVGGKPNENFLDVPAFGSDSTIGNIVATYPRKELLTKITNSVTTKSNVFAVWITTGYFEVTNDTTQPPTLGLEIGKADGINIRHRMFAIVDRTNMVTGIGSSSVNVPGNGFVAIAGNLTHPNGKNTPIQNGMILTFDPNTDNEETVQVFNGGGNFTKPHAVNCTVINRGNPGPWVGYDRTKDRDVVPYAEIIE
jgi:hypothetical protein